MSHLDDLPKLLTPAEVAEYLDVSEDSLARWRTSGDGPAPIYIGQRVAYTVTSVREYITAQESGSKAASPAAMQRALMEGSASRRAANAQRLRDMQALDRDSDGESYGVTVSAVGATPGEQIERVNLCPPTDIVAPAAPEFLKGR